MLSRWWAADARVEGHQCKAKQGPSRREPRRLNLTSTIVRFLDRAQGGKRIYLVTMAALCFFIIAPSLLHSVDALRSKIASYPAFSHARWVGARVAPEGSHD